MADDAPLHFREMFFALLHRIASLLDVPILKTFKKYHPLEYSENSSREISRNGICILKASILYLHFDLQHSETPPPQPANVNTLFMIVN